MEVTKWKEIDGDNTLALDWPLNEDSVVWEIGGFEGRWAAQVWEKFHCNIVIFEPQGWAVERLRERFRDNPKITIHPYGLWTHHATLVIADYFTDGASVLKKHVREEGKGEFRSIYHEIYNAGYIDLALMNTEGAEYYLIPDMILNGILVRLKYFWCQFHPGLITDGEQRFEWIGNGMGKTHRLLWDCYPTAVAWERK